MKIRFQDFTMQRQYEDLIKSGLHWKTSERKVIQIFKEYDGDDE